MAVVSKPLNLQKTRGYQWRGNVHTFHLIPSGTLCDHWSDHRDALKTGPILYKNFFLQRVDGFPYVEASISKRMIALVEKCIKKYFFISCPLNVVYFNFNRQFSPTHFLQNASRNGGRMQQLYSDSLIFEVFPSLMWVQLNLNLWCFSYSSFVTIQKST